MRSSSPNPKLQTSFNAFFNFPLVLFLLVFGFLSCEPQSQPKLASNPEPEVTAPALLELDKEAVSLLKRGLNALSGLEKFSLTTQQTLEDVVDNRIRIDLEMSADLSVARPDRIRVERHGLEMHQLLFYDGSVFTLHNPHDKVYASESLQGTIEDMFHMVRDTFGIKASAADLIYSNSFELLSQNLKGAQIIGKEMIGEVSCDHLLFVRPNVSFQIWISDEAPYLPQKYVVTDTSTPHLLSYSTLITKWDLAPDMDDSKFKFEATEDVNPIRFMKMSESVKQSTD